MFVPPLENKTVADVQIATMKAEGIMDVFRISESGLQNAIALGVYSTEAAARSRAQAIESLGYQPLVGERMREQQVWYVDAVGESIVDSTAFARRFESARLSERPCEPENE